MSVHYLHPRVFKINVGFMLNAGAGNTRDSEFEFPAVRVSEDLALNYLTGPLRLSRTKEGILVCRRTCTPVWIPNASAASIRVSGHRIRSRRLFATNPAVSAAFYLGDDGILDLAPLLREESSSTPTSASCVRPTARPVSGMRKEPQPRSVRLRPAADRSAVRCAQRPASTRDNATDRGHWVPRWTLLGV